MLVNKRLLMAAMRSLANDLARQADKSPEMAEALLELASEASAVRSTLKVGGFSDSLILKSAVVTLPGE